VQGFTDILQQLHSLAQLELCYVTFTDHPGAAEQGTDAMEAAYEQITVALRSMPQLRGLEQDCAPINHRAALQVRSCHRFNGLI